MALADKIAGQIGAQTVESEAKACELSESDRIPPEPIQLFGKWVRVACST
jgi:hypothetical protein